MNFTIKKLLSMKNIGILLLIISCLCFVSCKKDKKDDNALSESSITVDTTVETTTSITTETTTSSTTTSTTTTTTTTTATTTTTTTTTTAEIVTQIIYVEPEIPIIEETTPDYSQKIASLQVDINNAKANIIYYEACIIDEEIYIASCQSDINNLNNELTYALNRVENVKKNQIKVFDSTRGWVYEVDADALASAEEDVAFYQGLIDDYNGYISSSQARIELYKGNIATEESNIQIYQSQIDSLQ